MLTRKIKPAEMQKWAQEFSPSEMINALLLVTVNGYNLNIYVLSKPWDVDSEKVRVFGKNVMYPLDRWQWFYKGPWQKTFYKALNKRLDRRLRELVYEEDLKRKREKEILSRYC